MKKRLSSGKFDMEMGTNIDLSLLRRPLTPFTGFHEAKSAFDKGTAEVRHLLLHECSLIYECNVCRNMFRSLANFISHKRVFCCKSALEKNDSNDTTNGMQAVKCTSVSENVQPKNETILHQKLTQTLKDGKDNKSETNETNLLANERNKFHQNYLNDISHAKTTDQDSNQSSPSYVFQCPSCSLTFSKSTSVIRHLAQAHKIPIRRIRMNMGNSILKRPAESVKQSTKQRSKTALNHEYQNLLQTAESTTFLDEAKQKDVDELNEEDLTKCIFCQMNFEDRETLSTHLQTCHVKLEMLEATTETPSKSKAGTMLKEQKVAAIAADVDCELNEDDDIKRTFTNLEHQDFGLGLQTISLDKLDISASGESTNASLVFENQFDEKLKTLKMEDNGTEQRITSTPLPALNAANDSNNDSTATTLLKKRKQRTNCIKKQSCRCKICGKQFNALSNLRRHISMFHYRSRKYGCTLCDYCAFRRYDIINHLGFVHKMSSEDNNSETAKLVRVNDVPYTKDDMEEDIVLCTTDEKELANVGNIISNDLPIIESESPQPMKRRRRRNRSLISQAEKSETTTTAPTTISNIINSEKKDDANKMKLTRQMVKRSNNSVEIVHASLKVTQKRPMRNRVKTVKKDFVYDLHDLLKKEEPQPAELGVDTENYYLRATKRRCTTTNNTIIPVLPTINGFDAIKLKNNATIKGAARRICLILVNQGLAASSTLPEIPTERPQIRPRLISMQRNENQAGPIIDSTEIDAARLKSLPLCDDSFLEKIAKESVGSFQMKPCLAQQNSALDSLLQKVDSSLHFLNGNARTTATTTTTLFEKRNELSEVAKKTYLDSPLNNATTIKRCYTTPEQIIPKTFDIPTKPQKRLPSLERLTETINSVGSYFNASINAPIE